MPNFKKELTPVAYSAAAISVRHFITPVGKDCFRTHWHERMELIRVLRGEMHVTCGANSMKLRPGDMAIFSPKMPHRGYANEEVEYDVLMFDVRSFYNGSEVSKKYLPAIFDGRARFQGMTSDAETVKCFDEICSKEEKDSLEVTAYIYRFIYLLYKNNLLEFSDQTRRSDTVMEMIEYIEENFERDLTTATIGEHFGYSTEHFCRKFKEATGLTPMNYLKIYRMEEAYKLLKMGERNVSRIAQQCGFTDSNYFTRCFKAHFGMPPSQLKI